MYAHLPPVANVIYPPVLKSLEPARPVRLRIQKIEIFPISKHLPGHLPRQLPDAVRIGFTFPPRLPAGSRNASSRAFAPTQNRSKTNAELGTGKPGLPNFKLRYANHLDGAKDWACQRPTDRFRKLRRLIFCICRLLHLCLGTRSGNGSRTNSLQRSSITLRGGIPL